MFFASGGITGSDVGFSGGDGGGPDGSTACGGGAAGSFGADAHPPPITETASTTGTTMRHIIDTCQYSMVHLAG